MLVNFIFQGVQNLFATIHFPSLSVEYHFHATITTLMCSKSCCLNLPIFCLVCDHFLECIGDCNTFSFPSMEQPICICCKYQKHTGKIIVAY